MPLETSIKLNKDYLQITSNQNGLVFLKWHQKPNDSKSNTFKILRENYLQLRIREPAKLSIKCEGRIETFSDFRKPLIHFPVTGYGEYLPPKTRNQKKDMAQDPGKRICGTKGNLTMKSLQRATNRYRSRRKEGKCSQEINTQTVNVHMAETLAHLRKKLTIGR